MLEKLFLAAAAKIAPIIAEKLLALLPVIAAAVAKAVADQIKEAIPDLPVVGDLVELADKVRDNVNQIPDIDIPVLSDLFDLTEMFNRKH